MSRKQPIALHPRDMYQFIDQLRDLLADWEALAETWQMSGPESYFRRRGYQHIQVTGKWFWVPPDMDVACVSEELARQSGEPAP